MLNGYLTADIKIHLREIGLGNIDWAKLLSRMRSNDRFYKNDN
jgi:hypothetical protein